MLVLEVVEADLGINTVPVKHLVIEQGRGAQSAINVLLVQDIEHGLEQGCEQKTNVNKYNAEGGILTAIGEFSGEVGHLGHALHGEDLVNEALDCFVFHLCLVFLFML